MRLPAIFKRRDYSVVERPSVIGTVDGPVVSAVMCIANNWRSAVFGARILNKSRETLYCTVYGETSNGLESIAPYEFRVTSLGIEDFTIVVPRRIRRAFKRVIVSMRGATLEYTMAALVPRWVRPIVALPVCASLVAAATFVFAGVNTLQIGPAPERVRTQSFVQIPYAAFGVGSLRYDVIEGSHVIRTGALPLGRGAVSFVAGAPGTETVRLTWRGLRGLAHRSTTVPVKRGPTVELPPEIRSFAMQRSRVTSGEAIGVQYAVSSATARAVLVDASGKTVYYTPLQSSGSAELPAPAVQRPTQYAIRIEALRGGRIASTSAAVTVLPVAPAVLDASQPLRAQDLVQLLTPYAIAGKPLAVSIIDHRIPLRLGLQTASGVEIAHVDAPAGVTAAMLDIPNAARGTYSLVVTVKDGASEQAVVLPVPVRAK